MLFGILHRILTGPIIMKFLAKAKPFLAMILVQLSNAGMSVIAKSAMNRGLSPHVLVPYRMAIASALIAPFAIIYERNRRPKMTVTILAKIMLLGLFEPVLDENLFYTAMNYTNATFTTAMGNILPAVAFLLAWIFRQERMDITKRHCQVKVVGTVVAVGGAMTMSFLKGAVVGMPWQAEKNHHLRVAAQTGEKHHLLGAIMVVGACCSWSFYIILQAMLLESYPATLSLTAMICTTGMVEGAVVAFAMEQANLAVWSVHWDIKLLAIIYGGVASGVAFYLISWSTKHRGPVFVSAFSPLKMVIVAILGSFFLKEQLRLGRILGSTVIVIGIYLVLWGKSKDGLASEHDTDAARKLDLQIVTINGTRESRNYADSTDI